MYIYIICNRLISHHGSCTNVQNGKQVGYFPLTSQYVLRPQQTKARAW